MTKVFIDRRKKGERRLEQDRCRDIPVDLFHRKRRKSTERRTEGRSISEDYFAYLDAQQSPDSKPCEIPQGELQDDWISPIEGKRLN